MSGYGKGSKGPGRGGAKHLKKFLRDNKPGDQESLNTICMSWWRETCLATLIPFCFCIQRLMINDLFLLQLTRIFTFFT